MDQRSTPKRRKASGSDAANLPAQEQRHGDDAPSAESAHGTCDECKQTLPRHLFPKKKFAKKNPKPANDGDADDDINGVIGGGNGGIGDNALICRRCRKNQTAMRCKQPLKPQTRQGRKADSGMERRPNNFGYCDYVDRLFGMDCFEDIVRLGAFGSAKDVSESMAAIQAACKYGLVKGDKSERVRCLCIGDGSTPRTAVLACFLRGWECVSIDPALREEWHGVNPKGVRGLIGFGGTLEDFIMQEDDNRKGGSNTTDNGHGNGHTIDGQESGPPMSNNQNTDNGANIGQENRASVGQVGKSTKSEKRDRLVLLCVHSHARLVGNASVPAIMAKHENVPTTLVSLPCCPRFRSQRDVGRPPDACYEDDCVFSACRRVEVWNFAAADYAQCGACVEGTA